jgi:hypothetical protein
VVFIGLGQTDESAHGNRYDMYLQHANSADKMIADLWYYIQTDPFYKNKTAMIITTDHGRGNSSGSWNRHGFLTTGSSETWLAAIGPGISAGGEIKEAQQIYQKQLAGSIAAMLGIYFSSSHPVAKAISFSENTTIKN